jgi:FdhE protein
MSEVKKLPLTPQEVEKQIERLMGEKKIAPEYLRLFSGLFEVEYRTEQKLRLKDIYTPVSKVELRRRLDANLPAIDPEKIDVSEATLAALLERIIPILRQHAAGAGSVAEKLLAAEKSGKVSLRELVRAVVAGNGDYLTEAAEIIGTGTTELIFIVLVLARPLMRRLARNVRSKEGFEGISGDRCPICGGAPLMARIGRDDGKRILECSLCGTEWVAKRIRCLACGNEDNASLGYIYLEENACRIDKCDKCHTYLKTVDERKKSENKIRALRVEDVVSLHLDVLAEEKGYHSLR